MIGKIKNIFNSGLNTKQIKATAKDIEKIKEWKEIYKDKPFADLKARISEMRAEIKPLVDAIAEESKFSLKRIDRSKALNAEELAVQKKLLEFMPEVYAMLNEVHRRKDNREYFDVQFSAGIILAQGQRLVEQYTGEGKTMTFQLPLLLYSLAGRGAHLVTVNDYLTKVGAEYTGHFFNELGISVGVVSPTQSYKFIADDEIKLFKGEEGEKERKEVELDIDKMRGVNLIECNKREAYGCDVTYGTNNELGFDYLRDNMATDLSRLVQRELYFCIIDEADSILIDEARTPLIISSIPSDADTEKYIKFAEAVKNLEENVDYTIDHKDRSVNLTEEGIKNVENLLGVDNLWKDFAMAYHLQNALKAKALFTRNDQYLVKGGEVFIVDEFTGRILAGRRYSEGLHQAIEAKEGVEIKQESKTFATITFQNFFRLYKVLSGGSGTIMTEAEEFYKIYGLESVVIPTNKPRARTDHPDRIFKTSEAKFLAVIEDIKKENSIGRPILVGTTSVENSELISKLLDKEGISHEVLNAKYHEQESKIVTGAGKKGAVTVATNMAGRGTDIVLGGGRRGDADWQEVIDLGGLHVIGTERHDARRIDNQLRGRTGRQGEPGSTRFYVSLEDKIMRVLGGELISRLMNLVKVPDNMPIELGIITKQIESAQKRIEGLNFDNRKSVVDFDDVMSQHREIFYTRRRNILLNGENAEGKFIEERKLINLNLEEFKDLKDKYKERIENANKKLDEMFESMVENNIKSFINEIINDNSKEALNSIYNFAGEDILAETSGKNGSALNNYLKELLNKNSTKELEDILYKSYKSKAEKFKEDYTKLITLITLETLDNKWIEHLEIMKGVREGIYLQSYAQRDPLVEYKNQAFNIFHSFIESVNSETVKKFFRVKKIEDSQRLPVLQTNEDEVEDILTGDREMPAIESQRKVKGVIENIQRKNANVNSSLHTNQTKGLTTKVNDKFKGVGRNDLCPCGSGKKFKKCHGK